MTELWKIPAGPELIEDLPVHVKPDWRGLSARFVGAVLSLLTHLEELVIAGALTIVVGCLVPMPYGLGVASAGGALLLAAMIGLRLNVDEWAFAVLDRYVQAIDGRIYVQRQRNLERQPVSASTMAHEWCHHWQQQQWGTLRYVWGYYVGATLDRHRTFRRNAEAMAYGLEVAWFGRDPEEAAIAAASPNYGMKWSRAEARELIDAYAAKFRREWPNPARWE